MKRTKANKNRSTILDEISGLVIAKLLDRSTQSTIILKVKFMCNSEVGHD